MASSSGRRVLLERVTARVFCHGTGGGNPVTVFSSASPLSPATREQLAQSCEWESVMVAPHETFQLMAFYMPSGQEVSFCAHAALGGAFAIAKGNSEVAFQSSLLPNDQATQNVQISERENDNTGMARLDMTTTFEETPVSHLPSLYRLLRGHLGVTSEQLLIHHGRQYPSLVNASIARPKTLVYVNSLNALAQAKQPKVTAGDPHNPPRNSFAAACDATDQSTGIYLYASRTDEQGAWECRQFPRASGYPEDPATGIAAAALAGSLYQQGIYLPVYKFYQGITMKRPSLIQVLDLRVHSNKAATFALQGRVEIDSRETIEITEDDN